LQCLRGKKAEYHGSLAFQCQPDKPEKLASALRNGSLFCHAVSNPRLRGLHGQGTVSLLEIQSLESILKRSAATGEDNSREKNAGLGIGGLAIPIQ